MRPVAIINARHPLKRAPCLCTRREQTSNRTRHTPVPALCDASRDGTPATLQTVDGSAPMCMFDGTSLNPKEAETVTQYITKLTATSNQPSANQARLWVEMVQTSVSSLNATEDTETLEGAMLLLEQYHVMQNTKGGSETTRKFVDGRWQMVFATSGKGTKRTIVPVPEFFIIEMDTNTLRVETLLGPVVPIFLGTFTWDDNHRLMTYEFRKLVIKLWGLQLSLPFRLLDRKAQFYFVGAQQACARSGKEGVILFVRLGEGGGGSEGADVEKQQ